MSSSVSNLLAAAGEHTQELPMSRYAFGGLALLSFLVLLGVLWFFRGAAHKSAEAFDEGDPQSTHH